MSSSSSSPLLRPSLLGGVDGVITSFAIVAGGHSGTLGTDVVVLMGLSSVAADGLSMGVSEYLSTTADGARRAAARQGLACFASFVVNGLGPIAVYVAVGGRILSVAMFALVQLMLLGCAQSYAANEWLLRGLLQTATLGGAAGGVAYGVGTLVSRA